MGVLLHKVIESLVLFTQSSDEFFRCDGAQLLLLADDVEEQV